jgi:glycosyltransferase involved in cell wall biosynthesis
MARVSVIMPAFEAAAYLDEAIASVVAQSLGEWELIVIDDGSTDATGEIANAWTRRDDRVRLLRQPNRGVAAARNAGFAASDAGADYALFLDADDRLEPEALASMCGHLDRHPDVGMAHCGYTLVDGQGRRIESGGEPWTPRWVPAGRWLRELRPDEPDTPFVSVFCLAAIVPSLALIRRSAYLRTPGWDEGFGQPFEDTNLFLHIALTSRIHHVPEPLVMHRRHARQSTADLDRMGSQERKLYRRWRNPAGLTEPQRAAVSAAWRFRERRLVPAQAIEAARRYRREGRPLLALRFLAGAARSWLASHVRSRLGGAR